MLRTFLFPMIAVSIAVSPLFGQIADEDLPTSKLRTLALGPEIRPEVYVHSGGEYLELPFSHYQPSSRSFEVQVPGGILTLFREGTDESGAAAFVPFKKVNVPVGTARILLLAGKGQTPGTPLFVAVGDNLRTGDDREWLLINATSFTLAFQLGSETKPIPLSAGKSVPFRIAVQPGGGAAVRVAAYFEDGWDRFYSGFWPVYENQRGLVIFVPDPRKKVRLLNFFESVQAKDVDPAEEEENP